ncbi:MAG: hypothetical protein ACD_37C00596G0007 [uncultured bacterium]|nr:MAG: hypothetical protein ACD_37C00596G0007 [uncultured bacterium]
MEEIISQNNLAFINKVIEFLHKELEIYKQDPVLWIANGSYVINRNNEKSDLDLIVVHDSFAGGKRFIYEYQNVPVHVTEINMQMLSEDGESRLYGSYFTGKIINPHILISTNNSLKKQALYHAGKFIAPLAGYLSTRVTSKTFTESQITALVFIAHLSFNPFFDAYFLNYFVSQDFDKLWNVLCKKTIEMLTVSESITKSENTYSIKEKISDYRTFHLERMKISTRHWSYGAVVHKCNFKFPDEMYMKGREKIKKIDPSGEQYNNMLSFLRTESGLSEVFI